MSRKKREPTEVFGLSFMDLISCGLGGVIILMLVFSSLVRFSKAESNVAAQQARATETGRGIVPEAASASYILQLRILNAPQAATLAFQSSRSSLGEVPDIWSNYADSIVTHCIHFRLRNPDNYGSHYFHLSTQGYLSTLPIHVTTFSNGMADHELMTNSLGLDFEMVRTVHGFELRY